MAEKPEVGSIVEGKVTRLKPFGAIVSIGEQMQGLVHISQVANTFVQDINDHIKVGDTVKVKVLSMDEQTNKIALSIKEALPKEPRVREGHSDKEYRTQRENRPAGKKPRPQESRSVGDDFFKSQGTGSSTDFEDKMREFLKQSNERQTSLNKRANKRSY